MRERASSEKTGVDRIRKVMSPIVQQDGRGVVFSLKKLR